MYYCNGSRETKSYWSSITKRAPKQVSSQSDLLKIYNIYQEYVFWSTYIESHNFLP